MSGSETVPARSKSYVNYQEIDVVRDVVHVLRARHPEATLAVLTFYKGQFKELSEATEASLNCEVLTVDSCQGSEFDYVVLSTVRANRMGSIGFAVDKQRINVAISRSILGLIVVGNDGTMSCCDDWKRVRQSCKTMHRSEWTPSKPVPALGTFESVMDAIKDIKRQQREEAAAMMEEERAKGGDRGGGGQHAGAEMAEAPEAGVGTKNGGTAGAARVKGSESLEDSLRGQEGLPLHRLPSIVRWSFLISRRVWPCRRMLQSRGHARRMAYLDVRGVQEGAAVVPWKVAADRACTGQVGGEEEEEEEEGGVQGEEGEVAGRVVIVEDGTIHHHFVLESTKPLLRGLSATASARRHLQHHRLVEDGVTGCTLVEGVGCSVARMTMGMMTSGVVAEEPAEALRGPTHRHRHGRECSLVKRLQSAGRVGR